jgi:ryanodine receptor 2
MQKRHPYLLPYDKVDPLIKKANRETALDTVRTLLAYGYLIEPPALDSDDLVQKKNLSGAAGGKDPSTAGARLVSRTYRAEKTYAISAGKWYYEAEILSNGPIKLGWSTATCVPNADIGDDATAYAFDCSQARKFHAGIVEPFGKVCAIGDVVGVMIDFQDKNVCFSLNGEFMIDTVGSEIAFESIGVEEGFVPAFTLSSGQKARLNFGQDVNSLRYFTNCGLQEGYEPFAVNMTKPLTFWYSNQIPCFQNVEENNESLEIVASK